jgi:hypothetical protein
MKKYRLGMHRLNKAAIFLPKFLSARGNNGEKPII